ncbi:MAG: hypothetical protein Q7J16_03680 [Candidatus Cloacimonadales bacterium]|nr:hypothetical protein [Candidatus Cloacimonadales bacterium]
MSNEILEFNYKFKFPSGIEKEFQISLEAESLKYLNDWQGDLPKWTELGFHQCPDCTLKESAFKNCPAAANLHPIMEFFREANSFDECEITLETPERIYSKQTSVQKGVSSMIGIIMSVSGCPILSKLKPMARFHLPFASPQETLYRAMSMYLVQEYFKHKQGLPADWKLQNLMKIYDDVHEVNIAFAKRLSSMESKDADVNALIILDNLGNYVNFSLDHEKLKSIEDLFKDL